MRKCEICYEIKNINIIDVNNPLKIYYLPCGHTFHNNCITSWYNRESTNGARHECPFCREVYKKETIIALPKLFLGGYYNKLQKYKAKLNGGI